MLTSTGSLPLSPVEISAWTEVWKGTPLQICGKPAQNGNSKRWATDTSISVQYHSLGGSKCLEMQKKAVSVTQMEIRGMFQKITLKMGKTAQIKAKSKEKIRDYILKTFVTSNNTKVATVTPDVISKEQQTKEPAQYGYAQNSCIQSSENHCK